MASDFQQQLKQLGRQARAERLAAEAEVRPKPQPAPDVDFAAAVGAVTPLKPDNRFQHPRDTSPIRRRPVMDDDDEQAGFYVGVGGETEPPPAFAKNGRGRDDIRRLQAGHWPVVASVDLHGYREEAAQEVLNQFVAYVQKRGVCGEVVHGSGLGSKDFAPVLKTVVRRWLMAHPEVLAYAEPHPRNDGAVLILLRQRRRDGAPER